MKKYIYYGFGKDYLKNWGMQQAFREIYQNFLDFGEYTERVLTNKLYKSKTDRITVSLSNDFAPESLDFLRVGKSDKGNNTEAIGKHGEGMKMAFLVFLRNGFKSRIFTDKYVIYPEFYTDDEVGECFCFVYQKHSIKNKKFTIEFEANFKSDFWGFKNKILNKKDVIFNDVYHGSIINKSKGDIFVGGLYVCTLQNFSRAFNFLPSRIPLDRDREVPREFDVNYYASQVNSSYEKFNAIDTSYDDYKYVSRLPKNVIEEVTPVSIGNSIEFFAKNDKGEEVMITNENVKNQLKASSFFSTVIQKIKLAIVKHLGLYELLLEFKAKYIGESQNEMAQDFDVILSKINK